MPPVVADERDADTPLYAEVALVPALPGKDLLTYRVDPADRVRVRPGVRVLVPLATRHETGVVVALATTPAHAGGTLRSIADVLDVDPIFTPELVTLCRWTARYYLTSLADVLAAALPGGLRVSSERSVRLSAAGESARPTGARERALVDALREGGSLTTRQLARRFGRTVAATIRTLEARGVLETAEQLRSGSARTRYARVWSITRPLDAVAVTTLARRAPRQHALYARIAGDPNGRLVGLEGSELAAARALVRSGVLAEGREEHYRDARPAIGAAAASHELTGAQSTAVETVGNVPGFGAFLLHGVTGSGKTEVYLQLAARTLAAGRSTLLLVPEIALTHQLVVRVQERFGDRVALLHSGLGPGERWDEWRRVARGEARVVVGTRSAVFAPIVDLGLVVVDEEHDAAYKQEDGLRYHGRDLALVRAKLTGCPAVLGSATPSVESYEHARAGRYRLLALPERVAGRPLPVVEIVDLRTIATRRPASGDASEAPPPWLFSPRLLDAMQETLERGEQTLLFLNRRGFATTLQCLACGEPAGCPACSVGLTLHQRRAVLLCHHCGYARAAGSSCQACGNAAVQATGDGTERIEEEIARVFPAARVGRLDRDTTVHKGAHRRILDAWRLGALDVLVGTQMVAKGHDVPGVTLVGVLLADVALNMPDFRAAERAFQLLTQVAGRAGRGDRPGRVIVQTLRPNHHSLVAAAAHDYAGFAPKELAERADLGYPPFARLAIARIEAAEASTAESTALAIAMRARSAAESAGVQLRGPAPAPLERLRGRYRWQLFLSSPSARALHGVLRRLVAGWNAVPGARKARLAIDVDPVSML